MQLDPAIKKEINRILELNYAFRFAVFEVYRVYPGDPLIASPVAIVKTQPIAQLVFDELKTKVHESTMFLVEEVSEAAHKRGFRIHGIHAEEKLRDTEESVTDEAPETQDTSDNSTKE